MTEEVKEVKEVKEIKEIDNQIIFALYGNIIEEKKNIIITDASWNNISVNSGVYFYGRGDEMNRIWGDPCYGTVKKLLVIYGNTENLYIQILSENGPGTVNINHPLPEHKMEKYRLTVLLASFHNLLTGHSFDVTKKIKEQLEESKGKFLDFRVDKKKLWNNNDDAMVLIILLTDGIAVYKMYLVESQEIFITVDSLPSHGVKINSC